MVRRVTATIAGPRVYNLIYAQLGSALIEVMPHGPFSVTVAPGFSSESVDGDSAPSAE